MKIRKDTDKIISTTLQDWLTMPILQDNFKSHLERREFKKTLTIEERQQFDNNKLRVNQLLNVLRIMAMADLFFLQYDKKISKLATKMLGCVRHYKDMSITKKLQVVRVVDNMVQRF